MGVYCSPSLYSEILGSKMGVYCSPSLYSEILGYTREYSAHPEATNVVSGHPFAETTQIFLHIQRTVYL